MGDLCIIMTVIQRKGLEGAAMIDKEVWERLAKVESSAKSAHHRLENIEKLAESVFVLANETKNMREDLNSVIKRVSEIEARPIKRYETIIAALISTVVGLIAGRFL